jgi:hypothetical protein
MSKRFKEDFRTGRHFTEAAKLYSKRNVGCETKTSTYLIVDSEVQLSIPTIIRERGGVGEGLSYWLQWLGMGTLVSTVYANYQNMFFMSIGNGRVLGRGQERGGSCLHVLE